jgi:hypothetical protein
MKKYITDALNPSGGILYHYLALKYRRGLWRTFIGELGGWLMDWRPPEDRILLVGASGGYTLPAAFLSRFRSIDVLEPDPLARFIFGYRFRGLKTDIGWSRMDCLGPFAAEGRKAGRPVVERPDGRPAARRFDAARTLSLLEENYPGRAVLFCNVLGQLCVPYPEETAGPSFGKWGAALFGADGGRSMASYHDRLSGPVPFLVKNSAPENSSSAELARAFCAPDADVTLIDHETGNLFRGDLKRRYFNWRLTPGQYHLIEGVYI